MLRCRVLAPGPAHGHQLLARGEEHPPFGGARGVLARPRGPGHPLQSHFSGDAQGCSSVLSPSAAFCLRHQVCPARCPAAVASPSSSGASKDERGSRQEMCFIRNKQLAPALHSGAGCGRAELCWGTHECPGSCHGRQGTSASPQHCRDVGHGAEQSLGKASPPCPALNPPPIKHPGQAAQAGGN